MILEEEMRVESGEGRGDDTEMRRRTLSKVDWS